MEKRLVIINADDFGMSTSVNKAITDCFQRNMISTTTLLANGEYFDEAVCLAKGNGFSGKTGIHFNLTSGKPLTKEITRLPMFCENGCFKSNINRFKPLCSVEKNAVYKELISQAERLLTCGVNIDHADSHHHIHTAPFIAPIVFDVCKELSINKIRPSRNMGHIKPHKKVIKSLYNNTLKRKGFKTADYFGRLDDITRTFEGILEIMVHPDYDGSGALIDRRSYSNGMPEGMPFSFSAENENIFLFSYGEL